MSTLRGRVGALIGGFLVAALLQVLVFTWSSAQRREAHDEVASAFQHYGMEMTRLQNDWRRFRAAEGRDTLLPRGLRDAERHIRLAAAENHRTDDVIALLTWTILLATAVIGGFAGYLLSRRFLSDVHAIREGARSLGAGSLTHSITTSARDELGDIAVSFNQMSERLAASRQELEREHCDLDTALVQLRATQRELVQSEKLKALGSMLAGLAHELNNPLASILSASELLKDELAESPHAEVRSVGRDVAGPLVREALRVRALVRNLLRFSRDTELVLRPVNLGETIAEAVQLHEPAYTQSNLGVHLHLVDDVHVNAEPVRLQQVWLNIIANARDAMALGRGTLLRITARRRAGGQVEVAFEDDGPGLAEADRVFEPFYTTKKIGEGTGLGLSIVERVVTEFGGAVRAENRPTRGARFVVTLTATDSPAGAEEPRADRATVPDAARILVIDDEPSVRALQQRMLQRAGYTVTLAASGREAQLRLSESTPDLVISDLKMPGAVDGLALYDWALASDWRVAQRFLFVTGDVDPMLMQRFGDDAPKRILRKPFRQSEYLAAIAERLRVA